MSSSSFFCLLFFLFVYSVCFVESLKVTSELVRTFDLRANQVEKLGEDGNDWDYYSKRNYWFVQFEDDGEKSAIITFVDWELAKASSVGAPFIPLNCNITGLKFLQNQEFFFKEDKRQNNSPYKYDIAQLVYDGTLFSNNKGGIPSFPFTTFADPWGVQLSSGRIRGESFGIAYKLESLTNNDFYAILKPPRLEVTFEYDVFVESVIPSETFLDDFREKYTIVLDGPVAIPFPAWNLRCKLGGQQGFAQLYEQNTIFYVLCDIGNGLPVGRHQVEVSLDQGKTWTNDNVFITVTTNKIECDPPCVEGRGECQVEFRSNLPITTCVCREQFTGEDCGEFSCEEVNNCTGHGECVSFNGCSCNDGWTGTSCNEPVCNGNCNDHGDCIAPDTCDCDDGYVGDFCEPFCGNCSEGFYCSAPDTCTLIGNFNCTMYNSCHKHGYCIEDGKCACFDGFAPPDCRCPVGYGGENCSQPLCPRVNECSGNGECTKPNVCDCDDGFSGKNCSERSCSDLNFCSFNGKCNSTSGECECYDGYSGASCNQTICREGCTGYCNTPGGCLCFDADLVPPLCEPLPEITCYGVNNCSGNGRCFAEDICFCDEGWQGSACDIAICIAINCTNGVCVQPEKCLCDEGWEGVECETPIQSASNSDEENNVLVPVASGVAVGVVAIAAIVAGIVFIKVKKANRRSAIRVVEPKYKDLIFGKLLGKQYSNTKIQYDDFEKMLVEPGFGVLTALKESIPSNEIDSVSKNVLFFCESYGLGLQLLKHLIIKEIKDSENEDTIFRANSFSTKCFHHFSKLHGLQYLFNTLAGTIAYLKQQVEEEEIQAEVDPDRLDEDSDVNANKLQLLLTSQKFFSTLIKSIDQTPIGIKAVLGFVKEEVEKKYPEKVKKALGAFIFLRFFCPAIAAPHAYGLLPEPPSSAVQRNLILLSKVMQNLANGVLFGQKEPFMSKLNDFIVDNKGTLESFYDQVAISQHESIVGVFEIPPKVKENNLYFIHNYVVDYRDEIRDFLDQETFRRLDETLKQMGPPPEKSLKV